MSATPAPPEAAKPSPDQNMAKVRLALLIYPRGEADMKVSVRESFEHVMLDLDLGRVTEKTIKLTIPEARALADHLNKVCARIIKRPSYRP